MHTKTRKEEDVQCYKKVQQDTLYKLQICHGQALWQKCHLLIKQSDGITHNDPKVKEIRVEFNLAVSSFHWREYHQPPIHALTWTYTVHVFNISEEGILKLRQALDPQKAAHQIPYLHASWKRCPTKLHQHINPKMQGSKDWKQANSTPIIEPLCGLLCSAVHVA